MTFETDTDALTFTTKTLSTTSLLSNFTYIEVTGIDCRKFLQGQISINADHIQQNKLSLAAICNLKGRCIALFFATQIEDAIYLVLSKDTAQLCLDTLKKYAVFSKVELTLANDDMSLIGICGQADNSNQLSDYKAIASWSEKSIAIAFVGPQKSKQNNPMMPESTWLKHLATQGIAWLSAKSSEQFLPHNLNLPKLQAVDFKKGCYTGQEVVARMHYKGKLKSQIQLFTANEAVSVTPLDLIFCGDKKAAEVICSITDSDNRTYVLALTKDTFLAEEFFRLASENGSILKLNNLTH